MKKFSLIIGILLILGGLFLLNYITNMSTTKDYGIDSIMDSMFLICGLYFLTGSLLILSYLIKKT